MVDRRGVAYGGAWRLPDKARACCTRHMCWLYVKYGAWGAPGVALVIFQIFPISCGVTGQIY